jgi:hypothetical protein
LENFSDNNGFLYVYDKVDLKDFPSNAQKLENERFFYDLDLISKEGKVIKDKGQRI